MANAAKKVPFYLACDYTLPVLSAVQALEKGEATPDQQKRFLTWLVNEACMTYAMTYQPEGDRQSAFAEGRRHVGRQVVKLLKLNPSIFRKATQNG